MVFFLKMTLQSYSLAVEDKLQCKNMDKEGYRLVLAYEAEVGCCCCAQKASVLFFEKNKTV